MENHLASDGALYELQTYNVFSVGLRFTKPESTRRKIAINRVYLSDLVHSSSLYPTNRCRIFLILGETDNDYMHALMVPEEDGAPELKRIPLTWAEARAILDKMWEKRWNSVESSQDQNVKGVPGER